MSAWPMGPKSETDNNILVVGGMSLMLGLD